VVECESDMPAEELTAVFDDLRSAFATIFGSIEVDAADTDEAGGYERPLITAGPYILQRPRAESVMKPGKVAAACSC